MPKFPNFQGIQAGGGLDATSVPAALQELQTEKARKQYVVTDISGVTTAGLPDNPPVVGSTVYVQSEDREYQLAALPASNPANWKPKGDGDAEDSYRSTAGAFDLLVAGQHINANQSILAANLPATKVYKLYFDADCAITFDIPIIGQSPMLSIDKKTWRFYAGDEFEFFKTADSTAIDGEVS